jgi:tricarboxylate carrier
MAEGGDYPPFSVTNARFDENTFDGRLQQILTVFDPRKLLVSDADLDVAMAQVDDFKKEGKAPPGITNKQLWDAKELTEARCHPDDGAKILLPFCFAAYVPMQPPIVLGFLWPGGGVMNQVFWQWYNQSYNAMVWYHNKNKSSALSNTDMFKSYLAACTAGIGLSVGTQKLGDLLKKSGGMLGGVVRAGGPFIGCVGAGWASLICMRYDELSNGVYLKDIDGKQYGKSKIAAQQGIGKCCAARVFWNIPILMGSPLLLNLYYATAFHASNPALMIPTQLAVSSAMICLGIYPAQAVFSQNATISVDEIEPEFRDTGVSTFYYNKGL